MSNIITPAEYNEITTACFSYLNTWVAAAPIARDEAGEIYEDCSFISDTAIKTHLAAIGIVENQLMFNILLQLLNINDNTVPKVVDSEIRYYGLKYKGMREE